MCSPGRSNCRHITVRGAQLLFWCGGPLQAGPCKRKGCLCAILPSAWLHNPAPAACQLLIWRRAGKLQLPRRALHRHLRQQQGSISNAQKCCCNSQMTVSAEFAGLHGCPVLHLQAVRPVTTTDSGSIQLWHIHDAELAPNTSVNQENSTSADCCPKDLALNLGLSMIL